MSPLSTDPTSVDEGRGARCAGEGQPSDAGRGALWAIIENAGAQVIALVVFIVLARFLTPADFGAVALAMMLSEACVLTFVEPIATTIVVNRISSQEDYSVAFWLSVVAALAVVATINSAAPLASGISGYERLPQILALLSPVVLVQALTRVPEAWLSRAMQFRTLAIRRGLAALAGAAAGLIGVAVGLGIYAIVLQQVVGVLAGAAALWSLSPWRPVTRFTRVSVGRIVRRSLQLAPNSVATYLLNSLDGVAVSILTGPATGGIYNGAKRLRLAPQLVLVNALGRVTLAQLSLQHVNGASLGDTFVETTGVATFATLPLFVGAALVAPEMCHLLLGPKWDGIAPILGVLMLMLPLGLINNLLTNLYLVRNRLRMLTAVKFGQVVLFSLAVLASANQPAVVTAWATLVPMVVSIPLMAFLASRFTPFSLWALLPRVGGPAIACLGMAMVLMGLRPMLAEWAALPRLAVSCGAGAVTYAALGTLLCGSQLRQVWSWLQTWRSRDVIGSTAPGRVR